MCGDPRGTAEYGAKKKAAEKQRTRDEKIRLRADRKRARAESPGLGAYFMKAVSSAAYWCNPFRSEQREDSSSALSNVLAGRKPSKSYEAAPSRVQDSNELSLSDLGLMAYTSGNPNTFFLKSDQLRQFVNAVTEQGEIGGVEVILHRGFLPSTPDMKSLGKRSVSLSQQALTFYRA